MLILQNFCLHRLPNTDTISSEFFNYFKVGAVVLTYPRSGTSISKSTVQRLEGVVKIQRKTLPNSNGQNILNQVGARMFELSVFNDIASTKKLYLDENKVSFKDDHGNQCYVDTEKACSWKGEILNDQDQASQHKLPIFKHQSSYFILHSISLAAGDDTTWLLECTMLQAIDRLRHTSDWKWAPFNSTLFVRYKKDEICYYPETLAVLWKEVLEEGHDPLQAKLLVFVPRS